MDTHTLAVAYVARLEARDWDGVTALLAEGVVYEMPQTRERITGLRRPPHQRRVRVRRI